MNTSRAEAYGRVMKTLADLAPSKFHDWEQAVIRDAADTMFFYEEQGIDPGDLEGVARLRDLAHALVDGGRLEPETVDRLVADIQACGPEAVGV